MSVFRADLVGPSLGGTTRSLVRGTAAAWVNFNGTGTIAARDSENVSSLTDNGTGDYSVNLTSAFDAADYCPLNKAMNTNVSGSGDVSNGNALTTSSYRFNGLRDGSSILFDSAVNAVLIHGDLA